MNQIRQGDILLVKVSVRPLLEAAHTSKVIMAIGETTGHAHVLTASDILEWDSEGQRYVRVLGDDFGVISHEDHDPASAAVVEPNETYQIISQREWDLKSQWRKVRD